MEIELTAVIGALKKLFWVPLVLMIIFGLVGVQLADQQVKLYTATSTLVIEQTMSGSSGAPSSSIAKQMSDSYNLLLETEDFRKQIASSVELGNLDGFEIDIVIPPGSTHLNVNVTHADPAAALSVANATVDLIVVDYANRSEGRLAQTTESLSNELELLRADREAQEQELLALEEADDTSSPRYRELSNSILRLDQRIADTEARSDRMRLDYQLSEPSLVPIKHSLPPTEPNNIRPEFAAMLGALLGGLAGAAVILFWAMANNVVQSASDWKAQSETSVLSEVAHAGQLEDGPAQLFLLSQPTAAPAEGIRMLVTGLDFTSFPDEDKSVLQVTSPNPSNGKSTVAANLAFHYAQLGKRVALVDCDLHRPTLHTIFTVSKEPGLTNLLINRESRIQDVATPVTHTDLSLIPSGPIPPNPAEMFSSVHFERLIQQLKADFDIVILDTPPILLFSDSHRIASRSDAILAVGRLNQTKVPEMQETIEAIERTGTKFLGTVWVGSKATKDHYYYRSNRRRRFAF